MPGVNRKNWKRKLENFDWVKGLNKYIFGVCLVYLMLSCRTQKSVSKIDEPVIENTESAGPEAVFTSEYSFETLKVKRMKIDFMINGLNDNFNGNLAVVRDSLIAISIIPLLGYEAVRILCTNDSIIVINRTDKTYHASSLEYYLKKYNIPVKFNDLQAVLLNESFIYQAGYEDVNYINEIKEEEGRLLFIIETSMGNIKLANQKIAADTKCKKIQDVFVDDFRRDVQMEVRYQNFNGCDKKSFPGQVSIDILDKVRSVKLIMEYGQVIFDEKINVKFQIQEGYTRVYM